MTSCVLVIIFHGYLLITVGATVHYDLQTHDCLGLLCASSKKFLLHAASNHNVRKIILYLIQILFVRSATQR